MVSPQSDILQSLIRRTPTRVAPLTPKFQSSSDRTSPHIMRIQLPAVYSCDHTRRDLSIIGLTSRKTPKNLCERDALPAEPCSRNFSAAKISTQIQNFIRTASPPVCFPNDCRSVHSCPEKSRLNDVGIASSRLAKPPKIADAHRVDGKRFVVPGDES